VNAADALLLVAAGVVTGVVSGLLGVGGGLFMIPAMVVLLGYDQHLAEGTSLLVILPTAAVGAATHYRTRFVRLPQSVAMAAGGILGALVGSYTALALSERTLRVVFVAYLLAMGLWMLLPRGGERSGSRPPKRAGRAG
jgi:uncharacterized membrane protein YfcA